jgi:hypothetical protein
MNTILKHACLILLLAIVAVASTGAEIVLAPPSRPIPLSLAIAWILWFLALACGYAILRTPRHRYPNPLPRPQPPRLAAIAALALLIAPALAALLSSLLRGPSTPLELIILSGMRNLALGLAALAIPYPAIRRMTAILSLFLILCVVCLGEGPAPIACIVAFTLIGCPWLVIDFWLSVPRGNAPADPRQLPWAPIAQAAAIILLPVLIVGLGPAAVMNTLAHLVASSGGADAPNPEARGGVDDGPNEVAATQNPRSIGFADSDVYLESDRHSLYDAFNEQYGAPKKNPQQDRSIAISSTHVRQNIHDAPENYRVGQTFSTRRNSPLPSNKPLAAHDASALAFYSGPTPAHIPLATFSTYNGSEWTEEPHAHILCPLQKDPHSPWMRLLHHVPCEAHADTVALNIKIGQLDSPVLPIPAHVDRFRVGSVDQANFFRWAHPGLIRVAARAIPKGTVIHSICHTIDPECLRHATLLPAPPHALPAYLGSTQTLDTAARRLAHVWTEHLPSGWSQIEAVVQRLRNHFTHNPNQLPDLQIPPDQDINHFLNLSHSGPDYLFASAAALLLRELGYPTRLTAGLYVPPCSHNPSAHLTKLTTRNIHFWAEVLLPSGHWIAIEPTPGFELLPPARTWWRIALATLIRSIGFLRDHPILATLLLSLLITAGIARNALIDAASTLLWHLRLSFLGPNRKTILAAFQLLETRSRIAGRPRRPSLSPGRWLCSLIPPTDHSNPDPPGNELLTLALACNHECYAPRSPLDIPENKLKSDLRRAINHWSRGRFKLCQPPTTND